VFFRPDRQFLFASSSGGTPPDFLLLSEYFCKNASGPRWEGFFFLAALRFFRTILSFFVWSREWLFRSDSSWSSFPDGSGPDLVPPPFTCFFIPCVRNCGVPFHREINRVAPPFNHVWAGHHGPSLFSFRRGILSFFRDGVTQNAPFLPWSARTSFRPPPFCASFSHLMIYSGAPLNNSDLPFSETNRVVLPAG